MLNPVNLYPSLLIALYLVVLAFHFLYALGLLRAKSISMKIGPIHSNSMLLFLLLLLNGVSLSVFFLPHPNWILANIGLHLVLTFDELWRVRKTWLRLPFLMNHIVWSVILYCFALT